MQDERLTVVSDTEMGLADGDLLDPCFMWAAQSAYFHSCIIKPVTILSTDETVLGQSQSHTMSVCLPELLAVSLGQPSNLLTAAARPPRRTPSALTARSATTATTTMTTLASRWARFLVVSQDCSSRLFLCSEIKQL